MRRFSEKIRELFSINSKKNDGILFIFRFLQDNGIKQRHFVLTISLNAIGIAFESLGIGLLLPIGEYIIALAQNNAANPGRIWSYLTDFTEMFGVTISIYHIVALFVVSLIGRQIITFFRVELSYYFMARYLRSLRQRMAELFLGMDIESHDATETGSFVNSITTEAHYSFALPGVSELIHTVGLIAALAVILFVTSPTLTGLSVASFLVVVFLFRGMSNSMAAAAASLIGSNSDFSQHLLQRLKSIKQIKIDQLEGVEKTKIGSILATQSSAVRRVGRLTAIMETTVEPLILIISICIFGVVSIFQDIELVRVGFFIIVIGRMLPLFKSLLVGWQSLVRTRVSILLLEKRIEDMISSQEKDTGVNKIKEGPITTIRFEDVSYTYKTAVAEVSEKESDQSVFRVDKINFELNKGELIGIVGPSGCGKSTLVELLLGLRKPDDGQILINGVPLHNFKQSQYRSKVGFVTQSPAFFEGSIRENLVGDLVGISDEAISEAARLANALDFILARPGGLDNHLSEYGGGLSVGQRQRLDITRALLRNPEVLAFDEPTSSIDVKSAELVKSAMWQIQSRNDRILVVISHNHELLEGFDKVIEMSNGKALILSSRSNSNN